MKKLIMVIVCLMTMVLSVNGQRHYSRYSHHYYRYSYYHPTYSNFDNNSSVSNYDSTFFHKISAGFGVGIDWISNEEGNRKSAELIFEVIACNFLAEMGVYGLRDNTPNTNNHISFSWKIGYIIPAIKYKKGFIGIGPLVGKSYIQETEFYSTNYHYSRYYPYYSNVVYQEPKHKNWEFGGIVGVRYGYSYLALKVTNKSIGTSIGFAY